MGLASEDTLADMEQLIKSQLPQLPDVIYAHLNPELDQLFRATHSLDHHGEHFKMALVDEQRIRRVDVNHVESMQLSDADELLALYTSCYPNHAFDPRMLETGKFYGIRLSGKIISAGGIHVYSKRYRVAAIGNIVTHPDHRNRGFGTAVTAKVCSALSAEVECIGLNVKTDNTPAITSYQKLGFKPISKYHEWTITKNE
jgi:predicted GNAT family acetyltransferase